MQMHALSSCAHELVAMRNQLKELGYDMSTPSVLSGDNTASIMAAKNPGQHRSALRHWLDVLRAGLLPAAAFPAAGSTW